MTVSALILAGVAGRTDDAGLAGSSAARPSSSFLAAPATGPVEQGWFSSNRIDPDRSGPAPGVFSRLRIFRNLVPLAASPNQRAAVNIRASALRIPERRIRVVSAGRFRVYGLGRQLYRSDDGGPAAGSTWTAFKSAAVVEHGTKSIAVSPANSGSNLCWRNEFGVWRSIDGGLSWSGLNQFSPNLSVRRSSRRRRDLRASVSGRALRRIGTSARRFRVGGPSRRRRPDTDSRVRQRLQRSARARISPPPPPPEAFFTRDPPDGRMWVSFDAGPELPIEPDASRDHRARGAHLRGPAAPHVALAALSGRDRTSLRTTNSGTFWDSLDGTSPMLPPGRSLPIGRGSGVPRHRSRRVLGASGPRECESGRGELDQPCGRLPAAPATDVRLDAANVQLFAALDGYGFTPVAAPHLQRNLRIVNGGDFSTRPPPRTRCSASSAEW